VNRRKRATRPLWLLFIALACSAQLPGAFSKSLPMSLREQVTSADVICLCRTEAGSTNGSFDKDRGQEVIVDVSVLETLKGEAPAVIRVRTSPTTSVSAHLKVSSVNFLILQLHGSTYDLFNGERSAVEVDDSGIVYTCFIADQPTTQPSAAFASAIRRLVQKRASR
jgi:hypothetical protein